MNAVLLVARREFRQVVRTRSFRLMLFGLPLAMALAAFGASYFTGSGNGAYVIADPGGPYAAAIQARIAQDASRPGNPPQFVRAPLPAAAAASQADFARALAPLRQGRVDTPAGARPLVMAVYIPRDFGAPGVAARIWTSGSAAPLLRAAVRAALTEELERAMLVKSGIGARDAARIQNLRAPIRPLESEAPPGRGAALGVGAAALAMVYLLLMAVMMSGSMMLQGVIEERSNKLLEAILACIRPSALMLGKLLGLGATGLVLIAVWVGIVLILGHATSGPLASFLAPVLAGLAQPWMLAALLFYFIGGYLVMSLIFLAVGSVSNSMQDAQGFLMPLIWALMIPTALMITSAVRDPAGLFPRIMSWIPVYTPFAMMARLGSGVAPWEIAGTGVLLLAFLLGEFLLVGRIFESNLLAGEPGWRGLIKAMRRKQS